MERKNMLTHPKKKHVILFTLFVSVGFTLNIIALTNAFTEPFFQKKGIAVYLLMLGSMIFLFIMWMNYFKNKPKETK
jgi:hypothetical protein